MTQLSFCSRNMLNPPQARGSVEFFLSIRRPSGGQANQFENCWKIFTSLPTDINLFPDTIEETGLLKLRDVTVIEVTARGSGLNRLGIDHVHLDHALHHGLHCAFRHKWLADECFRDVSEALPQ